MRFKSALMTACVLLLPSSAFASLIFDSSLGGQTGAGLGSVATILTITSPGSTSTESGSVSRSGAADVTSSTGVVAGGAPISVGNIQNGQTQTQTLGSVGITNSAQLAIVFNAAEPGNALSVTLTGLRVDIFSAAGASIFNASLASSVDFPTTFSGVGKEGFVFVLDALQAAAFDSALAGLTASEIAALRVGVSASVSGATGGPETFNMAQAQVTATAVPEPGITLLLSTALIGVAWSYRRTRR
jgi:PEP-CTERM motif-containing protein